jgi:hypothetical protein
MSGIAALPRLSRLGHGEYEALDGRPARMLDMVTE